MKQHCIGQKNTERDLTHKAPPMINTTTPVPVPVPSQGHSTGQSAVPLFPLKCPRRRNGNFRHKAVCWILLYKETWQLKIHWGDFLNCTYTVLIENCLPHHLNCKAPSPHSTSSWGSFLHSTGPRTYSIPTEWTEISRWATGTELWARENTSHKVSIYPRVEGPPNLWRSKSPHLTSAECP